MICPKFPKLKLKCTPELIEKYGRCSVCPMYISVTRRSKIKTESVAIATDLYGR